MIAAALTMILATAAAEDRREWPSAGGFDIYQIDHRCVMGADYPIAGRADIQLAVYTGADGTGVMMTSTDWSARDKETYELTFTLGEHAYTGEAIGVVSDYINKGFIAKFSDDFLDNFASARTIYVTRGDAVVANLNLSGSAAGVQTLRRCARHVAASDAAQEARERRVDYITADPFEPAPPAPTPAPTSPSEIITTVAWSRAPQPQYPQRAAEQGITGGVVVLTCQISPNGAPSNCSVTSETPADAGFGLAALRAMASARLSPATVDSAPAGARFRNTMRFRVD